MPADFLTMHKGERSRLQNLAIQLADKVNSIVEMNEKLIDNRGGAISGPKGEPEISCDYNSLLLLSYCDK